MPCASAQAQDDEQPAARITRVWFQHEVHNWNMRYLDIGTVKKTSKIGLGTWQFGAEEWGYGKPYAEQEACAIVHRALKL
jgi:hypothetical protein